MTTRAEFVSAAMDVVKVNQRYTDLAPNSTAAKLADQLFAWAYARKELFEAAYSPDVQPAPEPSPVPEGHPFELNRDEILAFLREKEVDDVIGALNAVNTDEARKSVASDLVDIIEAEGIDNHGVETIVRETAGRELPN